MDKETDYVIEDRTKYVNEKLPQFTTLLGEKFYPTGFWFNIGLLLIRTTDSKDEIKAKIVALSKMPVYKNQVTGLQARINLAEKAFFSDPGDTNIKIPGNKAYDFFVLKHYKRTGVFLGSKNKEVSQTKLF